MVMMTTCLLLQSVLLLLTLRIYRSRASIIDSPSIFSSIRVVNGVMWILVLGTSAQIAAWAQLYIWIGEFDYFADAFYFSAVSFSTLGYGDIVLSVSYRILGALEAVNGVLMIGVSTAVLMSVFQDAIRRALSARHHE